MNNEDPIIFFEETQGFNKTGVGFFLNIVTAVLIISIILMLKGATTHKDTVISALAGFTLVTILLNIFLRTARLQTQITSTGILVRYPPFITTYKSYSWQQIKQAYVRTYKPILEFGGWGIRWGLNGKAYNVSGNQGIQLIFSNGKKLLIGTRRPNDAAEALRRVQTA